MNKNSKVLSLVAGTAVLFAGILTAAEKKKAATGASEDVFYIYTEGKIDAAAVDLSADFVKKLLDAIEALEKKQEK